MGMQHFLSGSLAGTSRACPCLFTRSSTLTHSLPFSFFTFAALIVVIRNDLCGCNVSSRSHPHADGGKANDGGSDQDRGSRKHVKPKERKMKLTMCVRWQTAVGVVEKEGLLGLYRGVSPTLIGAFPYEGKMSLQAAWHGHNCPFTVSYL
eukprot:766894-Hanusia_phi.AAC.5